MAKYLKRYNARLALQKLKESRTWIVKKHMLLETEDADLELNPGDPVILGATEAGEVAIKDPKAVVVIADDAVAAKVVDAITNAEALGDVEFIDKPALDAALDGASVEDIIDGLADSDDETIETAVASTADDASVEEKCEAIAENIISTKDAMYCERAYIAEEGEDSLELAAVKTPAEDVIDITQYDEFTSKIQELGGSIQPGAKEIALNSQGLVMGYYDQEAGAGKIFPTVTFANPDEMSEFEAGQSDAALAAVQSDPALEACEESVIEEALKTYEESAMSAKDLNTLTESLVKAGVAESELGKIANTFVKSSLKEGVNVFDTKLGKVVACFSERVEADNYIAESGEETRYTKRFFG